MSDTSVGGSDISLGRDGIIRVISHSRAKHTLADAKASMEAIEKLVGGRRRPMLLNLSITGGVEQAANDYYRQVGSKTASAIAVVTASMVGRIIGNIMIGLNEGVMPIKLFSDEDSALAWLATQPGAN